MNFREDILQQTWFLHIGDEQLKGVREAIAVYELLPACENPGKDASPEESSEASRVKAVRAAYTTCRSRNALQTKKCIDNLYV